MLVFIDESRPQHSEQDGWIAPAGVCLLRDFHRGVARELFNHTRRFWKVRAPDGRPASRRNAETAGAGDNG